MLPILYNGPLLTKATPGAAGYDLPSTIATVIPPMSRAIIPTGLSLEIPPRWQGEVRSRSGLAAKHGVFVLNSPGTIDSDYRGEIKVILFNSDSQPFVVNIGDRIAQLVFSVAVEATFIPIVAPSSTERGDKGFGSTGV